MEPEVARLGEKLNQTETSLWSAREFNQAFKETGEARQ